MTRRWMWGATALGLSAILAAACSSEPEERAGERATATGGDTAQGGGDGAADGGRQTEGSGGAAEPGGASNTGGSATGGRATGGDGTAAAGAGAVGVGGRPTGGAPSGGAGGEGGQVPGGATGGAAIATGGESSTGGQASGGTAAGAAGDAATGGAGGDSPTGGAGGDSPTGGAGGASGTTGAATAWMDQVPAIADVEIVTDSTTCAPPCGVVMDANDEYVGGAEGATLFYDPATGTATLRNDPENAAPGEVKIMSFTWEPGDYGYGSWVSGPLFWVFAQNSEYDHGYSEWADHLIRAQLHDPDTGTDYLVVYSYDGTGTHGVRIHELRIPECDALGDGLCLSATDCPLVEAGSTGLSADCQSCYDRLEYCTTTECPDACPGGAGNGCLNCQTNANCHLDFMNCSGLDYMPPNTLQLPDW